MVLDVAVTPTVAGHRASAATTFEAKTDVSELVTKVPAVPPTLQVLVPLVPGVTLPHAKPLRFDPPGKNADTLRSPFVLLVAVTVLVLEVAVTPAPIGHALIAAARFVASVVVLELVAKVPAVPPTLHVFEPLEPVVTAPHAKLLRVSATENVATVESPGVVSVTVTVFVLGPAVKPIPAGHKAIAATMFEARVDVLELVAKVPAVVLEHAFVPLSPGVVVPQV